MAGQPGWEIPEKVPKDTGLIVILQYEKQFEGFILILPANQTD